MYNIRALSARCSDSSTYSAVLRCLIPSLPSTHKISHTIIHICSGPLIHLSRTVSPPIRCSSVMTTSAQARLDRLLKGKSKPEVPKEKEALTFWEKELINAEQERHPKPEHETAHHAEEEGSSGGEDDYVLAQASSHQQNPSKISRSKQTHRKLRPPEQARTPSDNTQIMYLPMGQGNEDFHMNDLNAQSEDDYNFEPLSSSHELVGRFCIFSLVAKFPYKYMRDPKSLVSRRFFAAEKVYQRNWHMHYLFGLESYASKPLMLVPLEQVEKLIKDIGQEFQIAIDVPKFPFQISFYKDGTPTPTAAGQVNSKADMAEIQSNMPCAPEDYTSALAMLSETQMQDRAAWEEKMERAFEAEKRKKASKRHGAIRRARIFKNDANALERVQRYLGLKQKDSPSITMEPGKSPQAAQIRNTDGTQSRSTFLDTENPTFYPFENDTIMISIDVESWESDHSLITEIGVSTLDTADISGLAPGNQGEEWIKKIRSRHVRIKGRERLRNFRFCQGYPDMFQFGRSEFATIEEAPELVDSCFEYPFSDGFMCEGPIKDESADLTAPPVPAVHNIDHGPDTDTGKPRSLLLIGHDLDGDLAYLNSLGSTVFSNKPSVTSDGTPSRRQRVLSSIQEQLDTATLYKALTKSAQTRSVSKMCKDLDILAQYPHNAGNDARYTLEAFIKISIKARQQADEAMKPA